ncbi:MAG: hypothetical protein [Chaetfec virus UA24_2329]|nr:MAG: hypothetical protein [Chaetfec virus UA24_2329]
MIPQESRREDIKKGLSLILSCIESAPYVDYCNGILRFPSAYEPLVLLGSYGFSFSYMKEFSFISNKSEFVCSISIDGLFKYILKNSTKSDCYVTFQKKAQKK